MEVMASRRDLAARANERHRPDASKPQTGLSPTSDPQHHDVGEGGRGRASDRGIAVKESKARHSDARRDERRDEGQGVGVVRPEQDRPIRVVVVDDDPLVRAGLRFMLGGSADIEVVAEAEDGIEAEAAADAHFPDVVLMDLRMPRRDGITATKRLRARRSPPEVIVLTTFHADEQVLESLRAGASGFLLKDTPPQDIIGAVRSVVRGASFLSPDVARQLINHVAAPESGPGRGRAAARLAALTPRELDVAVAIGRGCSNADIARELDMSITTAKGHVSNLLTKLSFNNRVQIALIVHDAGLV